MAIKVNLESIKIPVEISDLKYEIDVTDDKYEEFIKNFNVFLTKIENLDEDKTEDISLLKKMVKDVYDELLGASAYDEIYAKMPNIAFVASVLVNVVTQLMEEMDNAIQTKPKTKVASKKPVKKK